MITTVLFDLDGTLLPMDQEIFVKHYLRLLAVNMAKYGYDPDLLVKAVWDGTEAMYANDGSIQNDALFWRVFETSFGTRVYDDMPIFDKFYLNEFQQAQSSCGYDERSAELIRSIHSMGLRTILATNPLFPAEATRSRVRWAGLKPDDFALITTYENSRFCKPSLEYYSDILEALKLKPAECIMVGNDVDEDMVAAKLGMKVFLLTDNLINRHNTCIDGYPHGSFAELLKYIEELV